MMQPEIITPHALQTRRTFIDACVIGDTVIIPGIPGTHIRISKVVLTAGGAAVITLKEGMRESMGGFRLAINGHVALMFELDMPLALPKGRALVLNLSEAIRITGHVEYTQA